MTSAISAFGTVLQIGDGATPENFTDIAELRDMVGPALSADTEDVTPHGAAGGWEEHIATILRTGEITFMVNYDPTNATHIQLWTDMAARTLRNFQLVFPDIGGTTWSFAALITGFTPTEPVGGAFTADVTLKLSGQPTLA